MRPDSGNLNGKASKFLKKAHKNSLYQAHISKGEESNKSVIAEESSGAEKQTSQSLNNSKITERDENSGSKNENEKTPNKTKVKRDQDTQKKVSGFKSSKFRTSLHNNNLEAPTPKAASRKTINDIRIKTWSRQTFDHEVSREILQNVYKNTEELKLKDKEFRRKSKIHQSADFTVRKRRRSAKRKLFIEDSIDKGKVLVLNKKKQIKIDSSKRSKTSDKLRRIRRKSRVLDQSTASTEKFSSTTSIISPAKKSYKLGILGTRKAENRKNNGYSKNKAQAEFLSILEKNREGVRKRSMIFDGSGANNAEVKNSTGNGFFMRGKKKRKRKIQLNQDLKVVRPRKG
jgi:hypothetical protein